MSRSLQERVADAQRRIQEEVQAALQQHAVANQREQDQLMSKVCPHRGVLARTFTGPAHGSLLLALEGLPQTVLSRFQGRGSLHMFPIPGLYVHAVGWQQGPHWFPRAPPHPPHTHPYTHHISHISLTYLSLSATTSTHNTPLLLRKYL